MSKQPKQVFLERQTYRRRRLIDFVRMVPVIGAILWAVPLLWSTDDGHSIATSKAVVYVFVVWLALVLLGGVLAWALRDSKDSSDEERS
ncbi:MAG: hypothetical protein GY883_21060 [Shimia sp.]|nr:hypothetical protein [Shimia sp.]